MRTHCASDLAGRQGGFIINGQRWMDDMRKVPDVAMKLCGRRALVGQLEDLRVKKDFNVRRLGVVLNDVARIVGVHVEVGFRAAAGAARASEKSLKIEMPLWMRELIDRGNGMPERFSRFTQKNSLIVLKHWGFSGVIEN